jgi:hypothetical protein
MVAKGGGRQEKDERRRARRRPILETFSIFVSIPKKGGHRLRILDLSEKGIGFEFDAEGESIAAYPVTEGEVIDLSLYLNQTVSLPLSVTVVRIEERNGVRKIGGEIQEQDSKPYTALVAFLNFVDRLAEAGSSANFAY